MDLEKIALTFLVLRSKQNCYQHRKAVLIESPHNTEIKKIKKIKNQRKTAKSDKSAKSAAIHTSLMSFYVYNENPDNFHPRRDILVLLILIFSKTFHIILIIFLLQNYNNDCNNLHLMLDILVLFLLAFKDILRILFYTFLFLRL